MEEEVYMQFTSVFFIFFFMPFTFVIYKLSNKVSPKISKIIILIINFLFYAWSCFDDVFKLVIFILIIYILGLVVRLLNISGRKDNEIIFKKLLFAAIFTPIAILFFYKYLNVTIVYFNNIFCVNYKTIPIIAPLGISYIVFSAISYLMDIYHGDSENTNLLDLALYLTFFPKIICGPIILYKDFKLICPQINEDSVQNTVEGINRIVIGLTKKLLIADYYGEILINMSCSANDYITVLLGIILYSFQLYMDFDGYSDISIGLTRLLGYQTQENFRLPYTSLSIGEFWRRWHISLGNFFRCYLYIPLGGNKKGLKRKLANLLIVFIVTGIWHGAGACYIAWGLMHGIAIVIETIIHDKKWYVNTPKVIKWFITMAIVFFGWQFFRYESFMAVVDLCKSLIFSVNASVDFTWKYFLSKKLIFILSVSIIISFGLIEKFFEFCYSKCKKKQYIYIFQQTCIVLLFIVTIISAVNTNYMPFIYFRY